MNYDTPEERDRAQLNKIEEMHREMMKKYGWYAHFVPGDDSSPTNFNAHTHGFVESWNHPDIQIVIYMPEEQLHSILIRMAELVKSGKKFKPGKKYDDVLETFPVTFAWAQEGGRRLLRMILPDKKKGLARGKIRPPYDIQWKGTEE